MSSRAAFEARGQHQGKLVMFLKKMAMAGRVRRKVEIN